MAEPSFGACAGDDAGPEKFADLDGRQPDAASGAEHEKRLSGLKARAVAEGEIGSAVCHQERGRMLARHPLGNRDAGRRRRADLFRIAPMAAEGRNARSRRRAVRVRTQFGHFSCNFKPRNEWILRTLLVATRHHQGVREVDPAGGDPDSRFSGAGHGRGTFCHRQAGARRFGLHRDYGCHGAPSSWLPGQFWFARQYSRRRS